VAILHVVLPISSIIFDCAASALKFVNAKMIKMTK